MEKKIIPVGSFGANCVILWGPEKKAWIVDPGADAEAILAWCAKRELEPVLVALTHGHFDHIGGVPGICARFPTIPVHMGPGDATAAFTPLNAWPPDYPSISRPETLVADLVEGAVLTAGGLSAQILATPGHTPGGVCFRFAEEELLLSGDTLFAGSCGRTDFPGGNAAQLMQSLSRLAKLPVATVVVPGHGGPTTIGREVVSNPFLS